MDYIHTNKEAWEEAFAHRRPGWGDDNHQRLGSERLPFLHEDIIRELEAMDLSGKAVAQFCCNNGRELLSVMQLGPSRGVGFDIAENMIAFGADTAQKAGISGCDFVACNILEIDDAYHGAFDLILFTIGAITWFRDLNPLFAKAARCLRPGGILLLHDFHPLMNMLPLPGDDCYDPAPPGKLAFSYFAQEPWVENSGMSYMTPKYHSKTFTSFSHPLYTIINAAVGAGLAIKKLDEHDYDIGLCDVYDGRGYPLSFLLLAEKQ